MPPKVAQESYTVGDLVLGRIKGFPWWPAKVVDPENEPHLGKDVNESKPAKKTAYLVRYYTDGDYSWLEIKDMKPLSTKDVETFLAKETKGKSALKKAYETAQSPAEWEASHAERMAKKASGEDEEPPKKKQRKSADDKPAAKPKKESAKAKDSDKGAKKDDKKKPSADGESEAEKTCRAWRSKLQRAFLGKELPKAEDGAGLDEVFTSMESWEPDSAGLDASKLPKVLKRIPAIAEPIPGDDKYNFKSRSSELLSKWGSQLTGGAAAGSAAAAAAPVTEATPAVAATDGAADETNGDLSMMTEGDISMAAEPGAAPAAPASGEAEAPAPAPAAEATAEPPAPAPEANGATEAATAPAEAPAA